MTISKNPQDHASFPTQNLMTASLGARLPDLRLCISCDKIPHGTLSLDNGLDHYPSVRMLRESAAQGLYCHLCQTLWETIATNTRFDVEGNPVLREDWPVRLYAIQASKGWSWRGYSDILKLTWIFIHWRKPFKMRLYSLRQWTFSSFGLALYAYCRALGQKRKKDWDTESSRMTILYGNATITITAASADDFSKGILRIRSLIRTAKIALDGIENQKIVSAHRHTITDHGSSQYNVRGWTL